MNWLYDTNEDNSARFTLGEYDTFISKTLICFGINPSTATPKNLDNTIRKIKTISKNNGYVNWIMLNIYPQRATNPKTLHQIQDNNLVDNNLTYIKKVLEGFKNADILFAYGNLIATRKYLPEILNIIIAQIKLSNFQGKCLCFKLTKQGNPSHPLYQSNNTKLLDYQI